MFDISIRYQINEVISVMPYSVSKMEKKFEITICTLLH